MARTTPPLHFSTVSDAKKAGKQISSVIGIVQDALAPAPSRGTDWMLTIKVCDRSAPTEAEALKVRWFIPSLASAFEINTGDGVILRNFNSKPFYGEPMLLKTYSSTWSVFLKQKRIFIPNNDKQPTTEESLYLKDLVEWWNSNEKEDLASDTIRVHTPGRTPKYALARNFKENCFYDMIGDVVKVFPSGARNYTIYITDYTSNGRFVDWLPDGRVRYPDSSQPEDGHDGNDSRHWPGPLGQVTLLVTAWDNQCEELRRRGEGLVGSTLMLRNMRVKINRDGRCLEGVLDDDKKSPQTPQFKTYTKSNARDLPDLQDFFKRRDDFKKQEAKQRQYYEENTALRKREEEVRAQSFKANINTRVKASLPEDMPYVTLADVIQSLPEGNAFHNRKYRVKVQVIDYTPNDIDNFAVKRPEKAPSEEASQFATQFMTQLPMEDEDDDDDIFNLKSSHPSNEFFCMDVDDRVEPERKDWVWRFGLLLQDEAGTRLGIEVTNSGACHALLSDAYDFVNDEVQREVIKQKLDILWGNLAELKERRKLELAQKLWDAKKEGKTLKASEIKAFQKEAIAREATELNNLYFDATIYEYGLKIDGVIKRTFALGKMKIDD